MSTIASFMYSSFFAGMLVSCFLWPFIVRKISKFWCIVLAFVVVGFLNLLNYRFINVYFIIFCRFLSGVFQNIHTVGKDYLFDVFSKEHAKKGLIIDSCFGLLGHLIGPVIGHWLYVHSNFSFEITCFKVSMIFFATIGVFITFFQICKTDFNHVISSDSTSFFEYKKMDPIHKTTNNKVTFSEDPLSQEKVPIPQDTLNIQELVSKPKENPESEPEEDQIILMNQENKIKNRRRKSSLEFRLPSESSHLSTPDSSLQMDSKDTLWSVIRSSLKDKKMRSLMILYGISSACSNSEIIISILYIQTKWEEQGLGLLPNQVVSLSVICFFPSIVILLFSGELVPGKLSVISFTKIAICIFSFAVIFLPFLRDLLPEFNHQKWSV